MHELPPGRALLVLNAGSSSLKFAVFDADVAVLRGSVENLGDAPQLTAKDASGQTFADHTWPAARHDLGDVLAGLMEVVDRQLAGRTLHAVGHRVVHGGPDHVEPARVTPDLLASLDGLVPLDPLHLPSNIAPMRSLAASRPGLGQVACFDTAFHRTMPPVATRFALPHALAGEGIRRYGFHGLSYEYIAGRLAELDPDLAAGRVIVAHLGSGASLCALQAGHSIETTTGFSALDGLVMATRCGALDPGVLLYLARREGIDAIEDMLYRHAGLLGVSGISGDIRKLLESAEPRAVEAVELFTYRLAREAGALVSVLGGLDGLVFTAGIGEHNATIRATACGRLGWLGLRLDDKANARGPGLISAPDSAVKVWVIPTDEETVIARHTSAVLDRD